MANEFIARKGIIVLANGAQITGSSAVNGDFTASGDVKAVSFRGSGQFLTDIAADSVQYSNVLNKPTLVSSSVQVSGSIYTGISGDITITTDGVASIAANSVALGTDTTGNYAESIAASNTGIVVGGVAGEGTAFTVGLDTGSATFTNGVVKSLPAGTYSSSAQLPAGTVSSSVQVSGSIYTGVSGDITITSAGVATISANSVALGTDTTGNYAADVTAGSGIVVGGTAGEGTSFSVTLDTGSATFTNGVVKSLPAGTVSASSQVIASSVTGIAQYAQLTGSNTFTAVNTFSNTTNSTAFDNGAVVIAGGLGVGKDVNISGSVNITGVLTVVSSSIQYVTSSQYTIGVSRVIVNDDDLIRFAGLSVIDSGSTYGTGSLLWDSLNNRWIYEADDQAYNSAIIIAGPKNAGTLGDEVGLTNFRIPVAHGDDHIDSRIESSSIRVDFPSRYTSIEAGLYVTGSITSSVGFSGNGANLTNVIASGVTANSVALGTDTSGNYASAVTAGTGIAVTGVAGEGTSFAVALDTGSATFTDGVVKSLPANTVSSSLQFNNLSSPFTGSFTGSFTGDGSGLTGIATVLAVSASDGATTTGTVNLKTQALSFSAGEGVDISVSSQTVTIAGEDATTTNKGIASFNTTNFTVSSGAVTSKDITINGTGVTLGGTRNITLAEITAQGATTPTQVTLGGGAIVHGVLFTSASVTSIAGPVTNQVISAVVPVASYDSAHFDYIIKDGTNFRTGTVMAVWDGSNVEFTDTSTNDIGNTLDESFVVDINGGFARLKFTSGTGTWTVKTAIRAL